MAESCCNSRTAAKCPHPTAGAVPGEGTVAGDRFAWFGRMIEHCYEFAKSAKSAGRPVVGTLCEYTPRELIMAAGGVPVCLCGGSASTIPAAEQHLPTNLCPLIKSTYGYHVLRSNPFLEMADLVVGETTCDGKKKMYELIAESRPMYVLELPHKSEDSEALEYWVRELEEFREFLSKRFATEITDERIRESIRSINRERALRRELAALMKSVSPPMTGRQLLDCKSSIWAMPEALQQYEKLLADFRDKSLSNKSVSSENSAPKCPHPVPLPAGEGTCAGPLPTNLRSVPGEGTLKSVRVLMTGVPMAHGAHRVLDIVENCGGLVVAMENCTGLKPLLEDVDENAADPLRALAEKYFHLPCSVMTPNNRRIDVLRQLAADYRPECMVELIWQACLTYDVESHRIKRFAEEELRLPYLRIETDYSPSDSARIAVRVEALFETVRAKQPAS